jgi:hypothetical protein
MFRQTKRLFNPLRYSSGDIFSVTFVETFLLSNFTAGKFSDKRTKFVFSDPCLAELFSIYFVHVNYKLPYFYSHYDPCIAPIKIASSKYLSLCPFVCILETNREWLKGFS